MKTRFDGATPPFALALWLILTTAAFAENAPSGAAGQADSPAQTDASAQTDSNTQADSSAQSDSSTSSQSSTESQTDASADVSANSSRDAQDSDASAATSNDTSASQTDARSDTQATAEADTAAGDASADARGGAQTDSANRQTGLPAPNQPDASTQRGARAGAGVRGDANVDADANANADATVDANANVDADANVDANARQGDARDPNNRDRDGRDARRRDGRNDFRGHIRFGRVTRGGILIDTVVRDSIFFRAGLREGDILVSIHGRPIRSDADFHRWVVLHPGRPVPVVILREGRQETIYVEYGDDIADADVVYQEEPVADMQGYLGVSFDANARDAAIVSVVAPNSPAEHAGLRQGDMIVALNGQPVNSYQQAIEIIASMRPGDRLGIDFARRQEDKTQAVLASKPGRGPRAAALPRDGVRVYEEDRANISVEHNDVQINQQNERRLLNREPADRRSGNRPLLPRLRN